MRDGFHGFASRCRTAHATPPCSPSPLPSSPPSTIRPTHLYLHLHHTPPRTPSHTLPHTRRKLPRPPHSPHPRCERSGCNSLSRYIDPNGRASCAPHRGRAAPPSNSSSGSGGATAPLVLLLPSWHARRALLVCVMPAAHCLHPGWPPGVGASGSWLRDALRASCHAAHSAHYWEVGPPLDL